MKKIFSLLLVVSMLFAMMITANAAYTIGFSSDKTTVKVGETFDVVLEIGLTDGQKFSGGKINIGYDATKATLKAISAGTMTAGAENWTDLGLAQAQKTWTSALSESGTFCVATFEAIAPTDTFVVNASAVAFTFRNANAQVKNPSVITPATIKIEANAPADPTVYGTEAVKCANTWTTAKSTTDALTHTFSNVAVATATCPATATEAGFKFGKGAAPADTAAKAPVAFDAKYVDGAGNVEYTAVMFNVDYDGDIYALSYYVPAN